MPEERRLELPHPAGAAARPMLERVSPRLMFVALPVLLVLAMVALLIAAVARPLTADLRAQAERRVVERAALIAELAARGDAAGFAALRDRVLGRDAAERGLNAQWLPGPVPRPDADAPVFDPGTLAALGARAAVVRDREGEEHFAAAHELNTPPAGDAPARVVVTQSAAVVLAPALRLQRTLLAVGGMVALGCGLLGHLALRRGPLRHEPAAASARGVAVDPSANTTRPLTSDAAQLQRVIDSLPIGISILDRDFRIEYLNAAHSRLLGWTNDQARGRRSSELLLDPPVAAEMAKVQTRFRETMAEVVGRFDAIAADGRRVPIQVHLAPLTDPQGRFDGAILMVQDQRAETRARQQADELSNRLRLFADAAVDYAMVMLDAEGRVLTWSRGARATTGLDRAAALGRHYETLFDDVDRARGLPQALVERALASGQAEMEGWQLRADGSRFWSRGSLYRLPVGGDAARLALIARDMTDAHEAAQRVAESRAELAALTRRLLAQEKDTTRRLAQVLHDELGQTLAAMRLVHDAGTVRAEGGGVPRHLAEQLDRLIGDANRQVRQVLVELRPPLLDEQGLVAALDDELRQRQALHPELTLRFDASAAVRARRWPPGVEYAAFMVAREALNNALRHARARVIVVLVEGDEGRLDAFVRDDGRGMPERAPADRPGHLGMVGMRERALAIGARLRIESLAGTGTTVQLHWGDTDESPVPDR